jgi:hypothetical protein
LWIGWRIEPEVEEFISRFVEAFRHGRHAKHLPKLPVMGGAPPPGVSSLPGAPLVIISPQGTEQQQLTV